MKHIKLYEDFKIPDLSGYDGEKIEYFTGSHTSNTERNRKSNNKLYDLLYNEDLNPYFDLFNGEELSLDVSNTEGFIGIYDDAEEEDFDYSDMLVLNNFIRDYLVDKSITIIIGDYHFSDYKDIDEYKKQVKSKEFNL